MKPKKSKSAAVENDGSADPNRWQAISRIAFNKVVDEAEFQLWRSKQIKLGLFESGDLNAYSGATREKLLVAIFDGEIELRNPNDNSKIDVSRCVAEYVSNPAIFPPIDLTGLLLEARQSVGRYRLEEACELIEKVTGERSNGLLESLVRHVKTGGVPVYEPGKNAAYRCAVVREFHDEAYWHDLNEWLAGNHPKIVFRFPVPTIRAKWTWEDTTVFRDFIHKMEAVGEVSLQKLSLKISTLIVEEGGLSGANNEALHRLIRADYLARRRVDLGKIDESKAGDGKTDDGVTAEFNPSDYIWNSVKERLRVVTQFPSAKPNDEEEILLGGTIKAALADEIEAGFFSERRLRERLGNASCEEIEAQRYTIREAAACLAGASKQNLKGWESLLVKSAKGGELKLSNPESYRYFLPYECPETVKPWIEQAKAFQLNLFLNLTEAKHGCHYRFESNKIDVLGQIRTSYSIAEMQMTALNISLMR